MTFVDSVNSDSNHSTSCPCWAPVTQTVVPAIHRAFFPRSSGRLYKDLLRPRSQFILWGQKTDSEDVGQEARFHCFLFKTWKPWMVWWDYMLLSVALAKYNHSLLVQETTSLRPSIQIVTSILTLHPLAFSYRLFLIFHNSVLLNLTSTYLPAITINLFISTDSGIFF